MKRKILKHKLLKPQYQTQNTKTKLLKKTKILNTNYEQQAIKTHRHNTKHKILNTKILNTKY